MEKRGSAFEPSKRGSAENAGATRIPDRDGPVVDPGFLDMLARPRVDVGGESVL